MNSIHNTNSQKRKMNAVEIEVTAEEHDRPVRVRNLETIIAGSPDKEIIHKAVKSWNKAYDAFLFPLTLSINRKLGPILALRDIVKARVESVEDFAVDIVSEINGRIWLFNDPESGYQALSRSEKKQWVGDDYDVDSVNVPYGELLCSDQGIPAEATAGENEAQGRTLGGDGLISFNEDLNQFQLVPSPFKKKMIHQGRTGDALHRVEPIIEHTGCGRRMQLVGNLDSNNDISDMIRLVMENVLALKSEFHDDRQAVTIGLRAVESAWLEDSKHMTKDNGVWVGIISKIAQRQAYTHLPETNFVIPIELYDKASGDLLTGFDSISALSHPFVLKEGGFTQRAIDRLIREGIIFSTKHHIEGVESSRRIDLEDELHVAKGSRTYAELQNDWLSVKTDLVTVTENLWQMYRSQDPQHDEIKVMVNDFLEKSLANCSDGLRDFDRFQQDGLTSQLAVQRLVHQLFHSIAYAWTLNTYENGNPPGVEHIEDHMATGESIALGAKSHPALGQGDLYPPSSDEILTQRLVLLHVEERKNKPLVLLIKSDTNAPAAGEMSGEESGHIQQNFKTLLELWPYLLIGDIVPYIAVRGKENNGAIARIGVSVLRSMEDIVSLLYVKGMLPEMVSAANSEGEIVKVNAMAILNLGLEARDNLALFRENVTKLANSNTKLGS